MARTQDADTEREPFTLTLSLTSEQEDALVQRVLDRLQENGDEGFLDVPGAAQYLSTTAKAIYALVERQQLPHNRAGGRLLFDRAELRAWVTEGDS
jgi:excisionase family DNA binding protein